MTSQYGGWMAANDALRWDHRPELVEPVLLTAFEGWADAADAASDAISWLAGAWGAIPFAAIDPEEFYDFTTPSSRPRVRLNSEGIRHLEWPTNVFSAATILGTDRDVVIFQGTEPGLKWRTYASLIEQVAERTGITTMISLGALLADVPHTRAVQITGTSTDPGLIDLHHLIPSRYEGPTGILSVVAETLLARNIPWMSFWAAVPHYVSHTESPKASLALVKRAASVFDAELDTVGLEAAADEYVKQISDVVSGDDDVASYVRRLEEAHADDLFSQTPPDGEALAAEIQKFLREHKS